MAAPGSRLRLRLLHLHRPRYGDPHTTACERRWPWTPVLDALFTSTSAVCVTGLVVLDTGTYWSTFGQVVILMLVQLGGFGFMTSSTLLLLLTRREATMRERTLLRESLGSGGIGSALELARNVIIFTLVVEAGGAVILSIAFMGQVEPRQAIWWGVFHAVSAFNNAGFDLVGDFRSLVPFNHQPSDLAANCVFDRPGRRLVYSRRRSDEAA